VDLRAREEENVLWIYWFVFLFMEYFLKTPASTNFFFLFCLFVVIKTGNLYFASRLQVLEVKPLGVYPLGPRSSSRGPTKGTPPLELLYVLTDVKTTQVCLFVCWFVCLFVWDGKVFVENWWWVSQGCGSNFIHPGKPWEFPPLQHPLVSSTSLRPRPFVSRVFIENW